MGDFDKTRRPRQLVGQKPLEDLAQLSPEAAVKEANARRGESVPHLLELEWAVGKEAARA